MGETIVAQKTCSRCKVLKPASSFWKCKSSISGLQSQCRDCYGEHRGRRKLLEQNKAIEGCAPKRCSTCDSVKPSRDFHVSRKSPDGRAYECKECRNARSKRLYRENRDKYAVARKRWNERNASQRRLSASKFHERNKRKPEYLLARSIRSGVRRGLIAGKPNGAWRHLPYSVDDLRAHIERQFLPGMSWGNYGKWQVDHITPLSSFEISSPDCDEFRRTWCLSNLRPLWAKDNLRKHATRTHLI